MIATCTGNALMGSLMPNVNGFLSSVAPTVVGKEVTGPQMAGVFTGAGSWRLEFSEASVALSCQDMIPDSHAYTISFANNRATLDIASSPKDVVLTVDGDTLNGASAMTVEGRISLGVHRGTDLQGQPVDVYTYQQVTRNCAKPALAKSNSPGVVGAEKNLAIAIFNDGDSGPPTPAGLRMNGTYAANTGFSVEFFPESAILGCGPDAARAYPYTVVADGKQAVVKVGAPAPLTLQLKPNNVLDPGSGSYQVQGRRITGQDANDDYTFAPLNATCNLAVLAPGPVPAMAVATTATAAAPAGAVGAPAGAAAPPAGSGAPAARGAAPSAAPPPLANTQNAPTGNAVLTILSGLPAPAGAPSALAGHPYILLRDDFATVVVKSGAATALRRRRREDDGNCLRESHTGLPENYCERAGRQRFGRRGRWRRERRVSRRAGGNVLSDDLRGIQQPSAALGFSGGTQGGTEFGYAGSTQHEPGELTPSGRDLRTQAVALSRIGLDDRQAPLLAATGSG